MKAQVNATRMELLNLKKRILIARRGHKLLKDKRDELIRQFLEMIKGYRPLREQMEKKLSHAFQGFIFARTTMSAKAVEESLLGSKEKADLVVGSQPIMNIRVPTFKLSGQPDVFCYGFAETSADLDRSLSLFAEALPLMVKVAEVERKIEMLTDEIERTRRRVNALEYVFIPDLEETIKHITMLLSEMERSFHTSLMKIKDIVRSH